MRDEGTLLPGAGRGRRARGDPARFRWTAPGADLGRQGNGPDVGGKCTPDELERADISMATAKSEIMEEAATILRIDDSTLWRKRKKHEDWAL